MYGRPSAIANYGRIANAETNPLQQIVMLYDGAMKFLRLAANDIEANDLVAKGEHTSRALDIINHLQSTLDFARGGDVAPTLDALYTTVSLTTLRASAALDATEMRRAANLLSPVRDAWETNARLAAADAAKSSALLSMPQAPTTQAHQIAFAS
jgi:flagellar secretion chaperone FliS